MPRARVACAACHPAKGSPGRVQAAVTYDHRDEPDDHSKHRQNMPLLPDLTPENPWTLISRNPTFHLLR